MHKQTHILQTGDFVSEWQDNTDSYLGELQPNDATKWMWRDIRRSTAEAAEVSFSSAALSLSLSLCFSCEKKPNTQEENHLMEDKKKKKQEEKKKKEAAQKKVSVQFLIAYST